MNRDLIDNNIKIIDNILTQLDYGEEIDIRKLKVYLYLLQRKLKDMRYFN